jgi:hypothetical protein
LANRRLAKSNKKSNKPKKATSWFEKGDGLCKAALLPVSGTKAVLIDRLSNAEKTSRFTHVYAAPRFSMSDFDFEISCYSSATKLK